MPRTKGRWSLLKRLPHASGVDRQGRGRRQAARDLVCRRGQGWAEKQDYPPLGQARVAALSTQGPKDGIGLHLRGDLPGPGQGSRSRLAALHHRGDGPPVGRDRAGGRAWGSRCCSPRPGWLAPVKEARGPNQHHACATSSQGARVEPGREHLADRMFVAEAEVARPALCGERGLRRMDRRRASRIGDERCNRRAQSLSVSTPPR
jgi:hypothetical protein